MSWLVDAGWVCVPVNYRLSPKATWPDHIVDVKRAIGWVREHIADYGGDPDFIAITGGSAGGHLSSLAALTANVAAFQPGFEDVDTRVQAAVPFYGIYNLADWDGKGGPVSNIRHVERQVLKVSPTSDPERWSQASPISWVGPDAPPMMFVHGTNDSLVPVEGARQMVAAVCGPTPTNRSFSWSFRWPSTALTPTRPCARAAPSAPSRSSSPTCEQLRLGDGASLGPGDQPGVLGQHPGAVAGLGSLPLTRRRASSAGSTPGRCCGWDVNDDPVAVGHERDRAAVHRFGGHMADAETMGAAAETSIGHQGAVRTASGAFHGAGDGQHLPHPGAALGTLIADDEHRAWLDGPGQDRLHGQIFAVEHPGHALEPVVVDPGDLDHRPLGRQRAAEDGDAAIGDGWALTAGGSPVHRAPAGASESRFSAMVRPVTVRQSPCRRPASSSARMTTGTPPMRSRSTMWYRPCGLVSAM